MNSSELATSERMRRIKRKGTAPELIVRDWIRLHGLRYRLNVTSLPGSPDLANRSKRWVIFVHGCFWHGHPNCRAATVPKRNSKFWIAKISTNRNRDQRKASELRQLGFDVFTVWECETKRLARRQISPRSLNRLLRRHSPDPRR